jgi:hypothetical protein
MWFDSPNTGGSSPNVPVDVKGEKLREFRQHSSLIEDPVDGGIVWVASSGIEGVTSVTIGLGKNDPKSTSYTVRLHFSEPDPVEVGERIFSVALQGNTVIERLDISQDSGGRNRVIVREFTGIEADTEVRISFKPIRSRAILCGVEIVASDLDKDD